MCAKDYTRKYWSSRLFVPKKRMRDLICKTHRICEFWGGRMQFTLKDIFVSSKK
jgi:hypothetical protein